MHECIRVVGSGVGGIVNGEESVAMVVQSLTLTRMLSVIFVSVSWSNLAPVLHGQERNTYFNSVRPSVREGGREVGRERKWIPPCLQVKEEGNG